MTYITAHDIIEQMQEIERVVQEEEDVSWVVQSSGIDDAYFDRNQVVQLLARFAIAAGLPCGIWSDPEEPDWPVIMLDLESGQVSWHIKPDELVGEWPEYPGVWDGHTLADKRARIAEALTRE